MIERLRIRDLGVIAEADVELGPGLVALTGETGAGKTMITTALGLLLGQRADPAAIRSGAGKASVDAEIVIPPDADLQAVLDETGADVDDNLLTISRVVANRRSRGYLGGRPVPASTLQSVGSHLVAVHGQHDQQRLNDAGRRRDLLDRFCGAALVDALARYRAAFARWQLAKKTLVDTERAIREGARESEMLRIQLEEIERVDPQPGEEVDLRNEEMRLAHSVDLRQAAEQAHDLIAGAAESPDAGAGVQLGHAEQVVAAQAGHDEDLAAILTALTEARVMAEEAASDLAGYASRVEADPLRLQVVQQRRSELGTLFRKYGSDSSEVLEFSRQAAEKLDLAESGGERLEQLRADLDAAASRAGSAAAAVRDLRVAGARELELAVQSELTGLAMTGAALTFELGCVPDPDGLLVDALQNAVRATADGVDTVDILLRPHPGSPARPVGVGASGGEMSRVMLALEVVLARTTPVPVFVFDEVDAGVGGKAAVEVGRRLARLARHAQVLVVTHLPQVAAFADQHLTVEKRSDGQVTATSVTRLDDSGRVRELSRMLAGIEDSDSAAAHAGELVDLGRKEREGTPR